MTTERELEDADLETCVFCNERKPPHEFNDGLRCKLCAEKQDHDTTTHSVERAGEFLYCYATCKCGWTGERCADWLDADVSGDAHLEAVRG